MHILCENIRARRRALGLTQKELAERLGISDKTVSRWESGVQLPEASLLPEIAAALSVSIDGLYGIEREAGDPPDPQKTDGRKAVLTFKVMTVAGALVSLLGSLLYRYFGSTVFLKPNLVDIDYYNTAKGATADIFAFVGMVAVFAGAAAVIIAKVRFSIQLKPQMTDALFADSVRYTGAAVVIYAFIFIKTAPEILSFGFFVPREVYGYIFVAALTGVLLWYRRQLRKRGIGVSKAVTAIALTAGTVGVALAAASLILRDHVAVWVSVYDDSYNALMLTAGVMIAVGELLIPLTPLILYIELLIKLRSVR